MAKFIISSVARLISFLIPLSLAISWLFTFASHATAPINVSIIDLYPWGYIKDKPQGIHNEIVKHLATTLEQPYHVMIKPYARVEADLRNGKTPFSFLAGGALNREKYVIAGPVIFELKFGIIIQRASPINALEDLNGKQIAIMNGLKISNCFNFTNYIRAQVSSCHPQLQYFERIPIKNYRQGLKMLNLGRVEGVLGSLPTIQQLIYQAQKHHPWVNVTPESKTFILKTVPISIVYAKNNYKPQLAQRINDQLTAIKRSGLVQNIYHQFMKD